MTTATPNGPSLTATNTTPRKTSLSSSSSSSSSVLIIEDVDENEKKKIGEDVLRDMMTKLEEVGMKLGDDDLKKDGSMDEADEVLISTAENRCKVVRTKGRRSFVSSFSALTEKEEEEEEEGDETPNCSSESPAAIAASSNEGEPNTSLHLSEGEAIDHDEDRADVSNDGNDDGGDEEGSHSVGESGTNKILVPTDLDPIPPPPPPPPPRRHRRHRYPFRFGDGSDGLRKEGPPPLTSGSPLSENLLAVVKEENDEAGSGSKGNKSTRNIGENIIREQGEKEVSDVPSRSFRGGVDPRANITGTRNVVASATVPNLNSELSPPPGVDPNVFSTLPNDVKKEIVDFHIATAQRRKRRQRELQKKQQLKEQRRQQEQLQQQQQQQQQQQNIPGNLDGEVRKQGPHSDSSPPRSNQSDLDKFGDDYESEEEEVSSTFNSKTTSAAFASSSSSYRPPPGIDPGVFENLPIDMKKEITDHYLSRKKMGNNKTGKRRRRSTGDERPLNPTSERNDHPSQTPVSSNSFTCPPGVDSNVFKLLPPEMQKEIVDHHNNAMVLSSYGISNFGLGDTADPKSEKEEEFFSEKDIDIDLKDDNQNPSHPSRSSTAIRERSASFGNASNASTKGRSSFVGAESVYDIDEEDYVPLPQASVVVSSVGIDIENDRRAAVSSSRPTTDPPTSVVVAKKKKRGSKRISLSSSLASGASSGLESVRDVDEADYVPKPEPDVEYGNKNDVERMFRDQEGERNRGAHNRSSRHRNSLGNEGNQGRGRFQQRTFSVPVINTTVETTTKSTRKMRTASSSRLVSNDLRSVRRLPRTVGTNGASSNLLNTDEERTRRASMRSRRRLRVNDSGEDIIPFNEDSQGNDGAKESEENIKDNKEGKNNENTNRKEVGAESGSCNSKNNDSDKHIEKQGDDGSIKESHHSSGGSSSNTERKNPFLNIFNQPEDVKEKNRRSHQDSLAVGHKSSTNVDGTSRGQADNVGDSDENINKGKDQSVSWWSGDGWATSTNEVSDPSGLTPKKKRKDEPILQTSDSNKERSSSYAFRTKASPREDAWWSRSLSVNPFVESSGEKINSSRKDFDLDRDWSQLQDHNQENWEVFNIDTNSSSAGDDGSKRSGGSVKTGKLRSTKKNWRGFFSSGREISPFKSDNHDNHDDDDEENSSTPFAPRQEESDLEKEAGPVTTSDTHSKNDDDDDGVSVAASVLNPKDMDGVNPSSMSSLVVSDDEAFPGGEGDDDAMCKDGAPTSTATLTTSTPVIQAMAIHSTAVLPGDCEYNASDYRVPLWKRLLTNYRSLICSTLLLFITCGIVISVIIIVTSSSQQSKTQNPPSNIDVTPSPTVSMMPTIDMVPLKRVLQAYSDSSALNQVGSPQHSAMFWLLNHDDIVVQDIANDQRIIERYAALVFFFATTFTTIMGRVPKVPKGWNFQENWFNPDTHVCHWGAGIVCDQDTGFVVALNMTKNGLVGTLPPEIGLFKRLESISLGDNNIQGTIPDTVGTLRNLAVLSLHDNEFTGTITNKIDGAKELLVLDLSGNNLNGTITEETYNLTSLVTLDLSYNSLSGSISLSFSKLEALNAVNLSANKITGSIPPGFSAMKELAYIHLDYNTITGYVTAPGGGMDQINYFASRLVEFTVSNNLISGELPGNLGRMLSDQNLFEFFTLKKLDMNNNLISGNFPSLVGLVPSLSHIDVSYNALTGPLPSTLWSDEEKKKIAYMRFNDNSFSGTIPKIGSPGLTKVLDLSHNQLEGGIPAHLSRLTSLSTLKLNNNNLKGTVPSEIASMKSLNILDLNSCGLVGSIPEHLGLNSALNILDISSNSLSQSIPTEICILTSLSELFLNENRIPGTIPSCLGDLTGLTMLNLEGNQLMTGTIPTEISFIGTLEHLLLARNHFEGSVPEGVCDLKLNGALKDISVDINVQCGCCLNTGG